MAFNFNLVMLGGYIASDLELKISETGKSVISFILAVNKTYITYARTCDFFRLQAWGKNAENLLKYCENGSPLFVQGHLQNNMWVDENGESHEVTETGCDKIFFVNQKGKSEIKSIERLSKILNKAFEEYGTEDVPKISEYLINYGVSIFAEDIDAQEIENVIKSKKEEWENAHPKKESEEIKE